VWVNQYYRRYHLKDLNTSGRLCGKNNPIADTLGTGFFFCFLSLSQQRKEGRERFGLQKVPNLRFQDLPGAETGRKVLFARFFLQEKA